MNINRATIRLYWAQVKKAKKSFFVMLITIPVAALVIDTVLPYILSQAIDAITSNDQQKLWQILLTAGGVGLLGAILNYIGFQSMVFHEAHTISNLRQSTFDQLIHKDHSFFSNQKIGAMTSRYIDFVRSEISLQDLLIIRTLGFILSVGGGLILLASHSLLVAGVVLSLIVALVLQVRWSIRHRAPLRHERKELVGEIHGLIADNLTNNLIVRTAASEDREKQHLEKYTERFKQVYKKDLGFMAAEGSTRVFVLIVVQVIAVSIVAGLAANGEIALSVAVFLLAYMQRIGSQLFILGDMIAGYDQALLEAQPMTEMLLAENAVTDTQSARELDRVQGEIKFHNASFRYSDGIEDVLENISITIHSGQKIGLVGPSGAGKSTIVQLLLRFSDITSGSICIDGNDIRHITQSSLRRNIAYVPQEPMLFHRSLRDNIAYNRPGATDAMIEDAAKKANAWDFIQKLPDGLETTVGERGIKLSGGQRQRIAIARAILKDAPILVLDEATSALDSESEKLIQASLDTLMKNRTAIVIAHRLSTIAKLDRIIVLENGKIIEDGSHQQLLAQNGTYARLWNHQSGGFIEE